MGRQFFDVLKPKENLMSTTRKVRGAVTAAILAGAIVAAPGCASQQAAHTTGEVTADTGNAVGSVLHAVGTVIMWPFHVIEDLFR